MKDIFLGKTDLDLRLTLMDSAQCFCWTALDDGYAAVVDGRCVHLRREEDGIYARGEADAEYLRAYLDLNRDYAALAEEFCRFPAAQRAIALYPGLHVLNQEPWETLLSFILSANNNVARIRSLVSALCRELGERKEFCGETMHAFPTAETLAGCGEARLRALGVGYRAPYLIDTAKRVLNGFPLRELKQMEYFDAHHALTGLPGVGDKVADCVLLFGCGHTSAFPVDVWVEKLLGSWFGIRGCSRKKMMLQARELLGENAGLLQQFLFHAARMGDIEL